MRVKSIASLFVGALLLAVQGCGGGGGGGGSSVAPGSTVLSGTATKGPIAGGTVKVFQIISSSTSNPRTDIPRMGSQVGETATTAADGSYSVVLPAGSNSGAVLVQITGGSYKDEATGATLNVADQFGANGLRAAVPNVAGAGALSVAVTPYTELAYQGVGAQLTDSAIAAANGRVAAAFGLPDIVGTRPSDPTQPFPSGATPAAQKYALALAGLSQYQKDFGGGKSMSEICSTLVTDLQDGVLTPLAQAELESSSNNYASSGNNPNPVLSDPAVNPAAPKTIVASPATPGTVAIGGSHPITAQVAKSDGSAVPDGTVVTFSTNLGSFLGATAGNTMSVPTVNGSASATLTSAAVGAATVTVRSGAATAAAAAITFFDPNAPAGVTLTSAAAQGITNGTPVLLRATVTRNAGGPVPDGTPVSFAIVSGSGTLSAATATSGGIATVNLTSTVAGASVTVSATAGAASQTVSVPFIAQPTQAIVTVRTTGTLPEGTLIGGVNATVLYAGGKGLSIAPANVDLSGAGLGSTMIPNTNVAGSVVLGLLNVEGIAAGEFATLRFAIAAGNFPTAADFSLSATGRSVIDTATQDIPGMGVAIGNVTIQ